MSSVRLSSSGVIFFKFSSSSPEALEGFFTKLGMNNSWPSTSFVVFRPGPSRVGSMIGQYMPQDGSSFDKLLLQSDCIEQQTECMRAIYKDVEITAVVLAKL